MKVKNRLSFLNSVIFGVIFLVTSLLIYIFYSQNTRESIYNDLKKTAYITALFYLEEDELNKEEFVKVKQQFEEFVTSPNYAIYDKKDSICYGVAVSNISSDILSDIRIKKHLAFSDDEFFCYGIFYEDNQGDFIIITTERKEVLDQQMNTLLWTLSIALFINIIAIILVSRLIANIAYRPFNQVIDQVNNIQTNNLDVQIKSPKTNDELQSLIDTFNILLSRISESVVIQKNFANYVSHEFRTPLTSMLGNLEVFSMKNRTSEEYLQVASNLIREINQMKDILNTLIEISDLRKHDDVISNFRVDELIWQIIDKISENSPNSKILVNIDVKPEEQELLVINRDKTQILIALFNLIENAVKYSANDAAVDIDIYSKENDLYISIEDHGIGIPANQIENISKPFYRADNVQTVQGYGIGLSLSFRILEKNNIKYTIQSQLNVGTKIVLLLI